MRYESRPQGHFSPLDGVYDTEYEYSQPITYSFSTASSNNEIYSPFGPDSECCVLCVSATNNVLGANLNVSFDIPQSVLLSNNNPQGMTGYQFGMYYSSASPVEYWVPVSQAVYVTAVGGVLDATHSVYLTLGWRMKRVFETPSVETHKGFTDTSV